MPYTLMFSTWFTFFGLALLSVSSFEDTSLVIETSLGKVRGIERKSSTGKSVRVFYKIPYAEPPIGKLRFKPPQPVKPWKGVIDGSTFGPSCVQKQATFIKLHPVLNYFVGLGKEEPSEDCLYLNIFVPKIVTKKLPVMVWVYGGAFVMGAANSGIYDGTTLAAEENVIVLTFNYRLSTFGFLYLGIDGAPGNMGLMDQGLVLKFVNQHIESFGGDPELVTFFGESAGSQSVAHHLHIEPSRNLFKRAILQSGNAHMANGFETKETLLKYAAVLAVNIGCPFNTSNTSMTLDCLMTKDTDELRDNEPTFEYAYNLFFKPVVDGNYIKRHPLQSLNDTPNLKKLEIIVGNVQDEATLFLLALFPYIFAFKDDIKPSETDIREIIEHVYGLKPNSLITEFVMALYDDIHERDKGKRYRQLAIRLATECVFLCTSLDLENAMLNANNIVYKYRFTHKTTIDGFPIPNWAGAFHGSDVRFVFGDPVRMEGNANNSVTKLSRTIMRYWANFARTGNPNISPKDDLDLQIWAPRSKTDENFIILDTNSTRTGYFDNQRCLFWNNIFPKIYVSENQKPPSDGPLYLRLNSIQLQ